MAWSTQQLQIFLKVKDKNVTLCYPMETQKGSEALHCPYFPRPVKEKEEGVAIDLWMTPQNDFNKKEKEKENVCYILCLPLPI